MTKRKLSETATVVAIATLMLAIFVPNAVAQARRFKFEIPFDFYAGRTLMPAGNYTIEHNTTAGATHIYDSQGHIATLLPQTIVKGPINRNRMVFNRYGSLSFLSEMQWADSATGWKVRESQLERDAKLGTSPVKVAVQPK